VSDVVLAVEDVVKRFESGRTLRDALARRPGAAVTALAGVSLAVGAGEVLAVVGESGCGKTTLANVVLGLERPTAGRVRIGDTDVGAADGRALARLRREVQVVFQDPYEALNPRHTVRQAVAEPLRVHRAVARGDEEERVRRALADAGLTPVEVYLDRLPHELSGGQRQRVCIAAALVLDPRILVADEPVSMLDVSTRAEILTLLVRLAAERGVALVMITHDLATVAACSDRLAVMYLGRVVETGPTAEVLRDPRHPYTRALLAVVPRLQRRREPPAVLRGEIPDASQVPPGCRFHPRCPAAVDRCRTVDPALLPVAPGHAAACLLTAPPDP
jgi:oligopeptide/dipeptide ABC transporter ATP-binding protein